MAMEIGTSNIAAYSPTAGSTDAVNAARGVQKAKRNEEQAVQRRREAQNEVQLAEKRLQQARQNEQAASAQVRAAQAEQQQIKRGQMMDIIV